MAAMHSDEGNVSMPLENGMHVCSGEKARAAQLHIESGPGRRGDALQESLGKDPGLVENVFVRGDKQESVAAGVRAEIEFGTPKVTSNSIRQVI